MGGKDKISMIMKLVSDIGIKSFIFTDFDYLLRDGGAEGRKYNAELHGSVQSLGKEFFCQDCILGNDGESVYKIIQKLHSELKDKEEKAFYTAKRASECKSINTLDVLTGLRTNGICILSCEIEDLVKDSTFLSPGSHKIDWNKIFDLKVRLAQGQKISEILDTNEISQFLAVVLER